jgi:hypothetical protein
LFEEVLKSGWVGLIGVCEDWGCASAEFGAGVILWGCGEDCFGAESSGESAEECGEGFGGVGVLLIIVGEEFSLAAGGGWSADGGESNGGDGSCGEVSEVKWVCGRGLFGVIVGREGGELRSVLGLSGLSGG